MYGILTPDEKKEVRDLYRGAKNPFVQIEIICDLYQVDLQTVCKVLDVDYNADFLNRNMRYIRKAENPVEYAAIVFNWGSIQNFAAAIGLSERSVRDALKKKNIAGSKTGQIILETLKGIKRM